MIVAERESDIRITTDTPYLALMGELWGVYCEINGKKWTAPTGAQSSNVLHRFDHKTGFQGTLLLTWINLNPSMDK